MTLTMRLMKKNVTCPRAKFWTLVPLLKEKVAVGVEEEEEVVGDHREIMIENIGQGGIPTTTIGIPDMDGEGERHHVKESGIMTEDPERVAAVKLRKTAEEHVIGDRIRMMLGGPEEQ